MRIYINAEEVACLRRMRDQATERLDKSTGLPYAMRQPLVQDLMALESLCQKLNNAGWGSL